MAHGAQPEVGSEGHWGRRGQPSDGLVVLAMDEPGGAATQGPTVGHLWAKGY